MSLCYQLADAQGTPEMKTAYEKQCVALCEAAAANNGGMYGYSFIIHTCIDSTIPSDLSIFLKILLTNSFKLHISIGKLPAGW